MVCIEAAYIERTHLLDMVFSFYICSHRSYRKIAFDDSNGMPELLSNDLYDLEDFCANCMRLCVVD